MYINKKAIIFIADVKAFNKFGRKSYMFSVAQIKAAHAQVKSGSDFPAYIQQIKAFGLLRYEFFVEDGHTEYFGTDGYKVAAEPVYAQKSIVDNASSSALSQIIADHQQGKSDFFTFCQQVADAGVKKWVVDTQAMVCTYYNLKAEEMLAESIPQAGY